MEITLPKKINHQDDIVINSSIIVVIGANGSGKTRFGSKLEELYSEKAHRISAQKSLSMPDEVSPKSKDKAWAEFWYGGYNDNENWLKTIGKINYRWHNNLNTSLLNDYHQLLVLLHTEEYEEALKYKEGLIPKPLTKLDRIQRIWEKILPYRKLVKRAGIIEIYPSKKPDDKYNVSEMSDGERVIFYLIGEAICAKENSIIIIDEPEMHLHKSITKKLWDEIEQERPDCTFIYLTHDIDFASTRNKAIKIWMKSFENNKWDYDILDNESIFSEQIYLEIIGSRDPILFIEGDGSNIDYKLLRLIFEDFTIKPLGSCHKVFETTKSFNEQKEFHHIETYGLIDRDRRTGEEVTHIKNSNIWVASVAEIENFLLVEEIVKEVATNMMKNSIEIFDEVKSNVISFFDSQKEKQALEHTLYRIERLFKNSTDNTAVKNIKKLKISMNAFWNSFNIEQIYLDIFNNFQNLIDSKNYEAILKVFNNKGLVPNSKVSNLCSLSNKNDAYLNYIIGILKQNNKKSDRIRQAVIKRIEK